MKNVVLRILLLAFSPLTSPSSSSLSSSSDYDWNQCSLVLQHRILYCNA